MPSLYNPGNPLAAQWLREVEAAARTLAVDIRVFTVTGPDDVAPTFREAKGRVGAILVLADQVVNLLSDQIGALALSSPRRLRAGRQCSRAGTIQTQNTNSVFASGWL